METKKRKISVERSVQIPPPTKEEVRYSILYGFRRGLKPVAIHAEFRTAYGEHCPSLVTISKWYRRFQTGHFDIQDDPREGRPSTSTDEVNVAAVKDMVDEDPRITQDEIAECLGTNAMAISRILREHLNYTKKSARWIPRILKDEEKEARVRFARFFLEKFENGSSSSFRNLVTGDESWFYKSEPETKQQSMVWTEKGAPPPLKAMRKKSATKIMFAIFFSRSELIAVVPLEDNATVNADWYKDVCLPKVFENILKGRPKEELRRYFLHHDNAPAHRAIKTSDFIALSQINEINPPPYSPDLAPCDFWLFPKIKEPLRGKVFESREDIISAVNEQLQKLKKRDFKECFDKWIHRLQKCINIKGDYVEKL